MSTKKLANLSIFLTMAVILGYIEAILPFSIGVPGIKLGLVNYIVIILLYEYGLKDAFLVSILRILIISLIFGNISLAIYSLSGAICSILIMAICARINVFSMIGNSILGGIVHNIAQLIVAMCLMDTDSLMYYAPFLILGGLIAGFLIGTLAHITRARISKVIKIYEE